MLATEWNVPPQTRWLRDPIKAPTRSSISSEDFLREGQQQNVRGIHTGIDQIGDAMHKRPRFAATGAGDHQRRAICRRHGRILLRVQLLGIVQRELSDEVLIRSPFQDVGLTISIHVGIRLGSEAT